jgi:hypothetical protein
MNQTETGTTRRSLTPSEPTDSDEQAGYRQMLSMRHSCVRAPLIGNTIRLNNPMHFQIDNTSVRILGSTHNLPRTLPNLPQWVWEAFGWCNDLILGNNPFANPDAASHLFGDVPLRKLITSKL